MCAQLVPDSTTRDALNLLYGRSLRKDGTEPQVDAP
jgi:hypothetical protein